MPFTEGWELQRRIHDEVADGTRPSTVLMLEHEPVYTLGRRTHSWERPPGDVVEPGHVPVLEVDRGGKATWHGPGQLTVYPIVRLASPIDVIRYVRALEAAVMDVCGGYGVATTRVEGRSGVWVAADGSVPGPARGAAPGPSLGASPGSAVGPSPRPERKICALGVRVARGVTMHGIGLNVDPDLAAFGLDRIIPCGIDDAGVTSLAAQTGAHLPVDAPADELAAALERHLAPLVSNTAA